MLMVLPLAVLFLPIILSLFFTGLSLCLEHPQLLHRPLGQRETSRSRKAISSPGHSSRRSCGVLFLCLGFARDVTSGVEARPRTRPAKSQRTERMQGWAGPGIIAFALTLTFAAFDWGMSLAPMWFSTMFGVYIFAGGILSRSLCNNAWNLSASAQRSDERRSHPRALPRPWASTSSGLPFFWTYIAFSQYLLIWYGNIPEETEWFFYRQEGAFGTLSIVLILFPLADSLPGHDAATHSAKPSHHGLLGGVHLGDALRRYLLDRHAGSTGSWDDRTGSLLAPDRWGSARYLARACCVWWEWPP